MEEEVEAMRSQIAEVTPHLYLCGASAVTSDILRHLGITMVVNCTVATPSVDMNGVECIRICVDDSRLAKLNEYFDQCADIIKQIEGKGGKTLVHCIAGVSRSATLCIAYLMKHQGMTLTEAYTHVKSRRIYIRPNVGFFKQLIDYEKQLFGGKTTVRIMSSPLGDIPDVYEEHTRQMLSGLALTKW